MLGPVLPQSGRARFSTTLFMTCGAEALHAGEGGQAVVVELLEGGQIGRDDA